MGDPLLVTEEDMIIIIYFLILCPSEYTAYKSETTPFCLKYTAFSCGHSIFVATATGGDLQATNFVMLTYTNQKKGVREKIGHEASDDPLLCPKAALLWQVLHLRVHSEPPSTPPARDMAPEGRWKNITPTMISKTLNTTVGLCGLNLGFESKDVSACSLSANVVMTLLSSGFDRNIIKLIGYLRRDEMVRYLHVQADPLMGKLS